MLDSVVIKNAIPQTIFRFILVRFLERGSAVVEILKILQYIIADVILVLSKHQVPIAAYKVACLENTKSMS